MASTGSHINFPAEQSIEKCLEFLNHIGIKPICKKIEGDPLLPGLSIENGCLLIDTTSLKYPGDILHEAGHIATVPALHRPTLNAADIEKRPDREAEEMMSIAWSYAACVHLNFDPYFVFHDTGYKGGGTSIADNFRNENYFGLPMLQWIGLTADKKTAALLGVPPYPYMIKWLRD